MRKPLTAAILLAIASHAAAIGDSFTYQGHLDDNGVAANGAYDLQFALISGGNVLDTRTLDDVAVSGGVFSVELDFDSAIDTGEFSLRVGVRPGASNDAYVTLTPDTALRATPQAQVAALAGEAVTVSTNSIYSPSVVDGALNGADIADGSIHGADVDSAEVQRRVSGTCTAGNSIRAIAANGTVTCEAAGTGSVTSVATGAGLSGGPITASGTIAVATNGINTAMLQDGQVFGVDVEPSEVQLRIEGSCSVGSSIRAIAENGSVTCEAAPAAGWALAGNVGTDPATHYLGTADATPIVLRAGNAQALRITPRSAIDNGGNNTANLLGGSAANTIGSGNRGVTVLGGGATPLSEPGFSLLRTETNGANGDYATVLGGISNKASGDYTTIVGGLANSTSSDSAIVAGGNGNTAAGPSAGVFAGQANNAAGSHSAVIGGYTNSARAEGSVALGGTGNCAGGQYSFAAGRGASVRSPSGSNGCASDAGDANGDEGSFVWADASTGTPLVTSGSNQFLVRADGAVLLNSTVSPAATQDLVIGARPTSGDDDVDVVLRTRNGTRTALVYLEHDNGSLNIGVNNVTAGTNRLSVSGGSGGPATLSNGGTWTNASSRGFKTAIEPVDGRDVLKRVVALDIARWQYKGSQEGTHMGPMAEDFKAAFDLAGDGKSIATVDADGVALAAIQGLNAKLESENAKLRARLAALETLVSEAVRVRQVPSWPESALASGSQQ